jgi:hypothetical protein
MNTASDNLEDAGVGRQADERLIHALLLHMHDDQTVEHREQRVQRATQAIRDLAEPQSSQAVSAAGAPATRTLRFPAWARRTVWAAAAMILVAVGVWVFTYSPTPALASLNDILSALGRPGDRTYRIQMEDLPEPPGRRPPDDRPVEMVPRPGLDDAKLYLRDGRQYLLVRNDPKGGVIFDGYDGQQSWRVRAGVVAETKEGLGAGGIPMPPIMADVPFTDLHQTLERIRVDYTVEQLDQAPLPSGGEPLRHVRVRRNSREVKGPETIEIWANPKTGMPRRIVFDDAKIQGSRQPCRITFELVNEETLSPNWFSPTPHIAEETGKGHPVR